MKEKHWADTPGLLLLRLRIPRKGKEMSKTVVKLANSPGSTLASQRLLFNLLAFFDKTQHFCEQWYQIKEEEK